MRILQVGKYYPPFQGGMETVLENLVLGLLEQEQDLSVIVAGQGAASVRETITHGSRAATLIRLASLGVIASQPLTPGLLTTLRRELIRFRPEVVHLHLPNPLLVLAWRVAAATLPAALRPPVAISYHADITRQKWGRPLVGPSLRQVLKSCQGITVSSRSLATGSPVLRDHAGKVRVIPFGIDPMPWSSLEPRRSGGFLFVGRLVPYKGLPGLLEAVASLPEVRLDIVGEGPLEKKLPRLVAKLGLESRVKLHGCLGQKALLEVMGQARGLVLPSIDQSETFGLVQLEAMAAGLPVVASDLPTGIREVGQAPDTCLLVPPGDVPALAGALQRLWGDPELAARLGTRGKERFLARFTRSIMTEQILEWYASLASANPDAERSP